VRAEKRRQHRGAVVLTDDGDRVTARAWARRLLGASIVERVYPDPAMHAISSASSEKGTSGTGCRG